MIKILIYGCGGTMGRVLADVANNSADINVVTGVDPIADTATFSFPVYASLDECKEDFDVIVDFSRPESIKELLSGALQRKSPLIIATTGHTDEDKLLISKNAESFPIFHAANMSLGINLMSNLIQKAATVLGENYDIEIIEKHHNLKKDAPSGTAYELANSASQAFTKGKDFVFGRHTRTDLRNTRDIGIHAVRGGTIAGEHQVLFAGTDEVLEIRHSAHSKQVFAVGALQAVRFIFGKPPGLYSMKNMIAEESATTHLYTGDDEALISMANIPYEPSKITQIFKIIGEKKINLDMISQTAPMDDKISISFTIPRKDIDSTVAILKEIQGTWPELRLDVLTNITKITVQGPGMEVQSGVAAKVFELMTSKGIALRAITTSETKISYIITESDRSAAIEAIKTAFSI